MSIVKKKGNSIHVDTLEILKLLWHRMWVILLAAIVCAASTFGFAYGFITTQYTASITLYVNNSSGTDSTTTISYSDLNASAELVDTYIAIIKSKTLLNQVAETAHIDYSSKELKKMLSAGAVDNTEVFTVSVTNPSAEEAALIANTIAEVAPDRIAEIVEGSSVKIVDWADVPESKSYPSYSKAVAYGFAAGLAISILWLLIRELSDTRIRSEEDLKEWALPVLGVVPDLDQANHKGYGYGYGYGQRR